jgi:vanillate/3-O-methylgallate O-demethylase
MTAALISALRSADKTYHLGWGGPEFTSWQDEQMSWKTSCCVGDWSFLPDVELRGSGALKLFRDTSVNSFTNFEVGRAKHTIQCDENGKVITEGVLMRMAEDVFRIQGSPAPFLALLAQTRGDDVTASPIDTHQLQVAGPNALALLEELAAQSLGDIRFMYFREIRIGAHRVFALRQGMAGEVGFELHGPAHQRAALIETLVEAGRKYGVRRLGRRTAMINHLEACFPTGSWHFLPAPRPHVEPAILERVLKGFNFPWRLGVALTGSFEGKDISDYYRSPVELGWSKNIKFDHEFPGRAALEQEVANPLRTIVTLEFNVDDMIGVYSSLFGDEEPYEFMDVPHQSRWVVWADQVLKDGKLVGISPVPGYSYKYRRVLSLTYIDTALSTPGTTVEIVWGNPGHRQRRVRAIVAPAPYKPDNRRAELRATLSG